MALETGVVIYTSAHCGWAVRNYAACYAKGIPFQAVEVKQVPAGDRERFLARFPYGKTPALEHGSVRVWESLIINEYLEEAFEGHALLPVHAPERAAARLWCYHCDSVLFPLLYAALGTDQPHERARHASEFERRLGELERLPRTTPGGDGLWSGTGIGLVDLCYLVLFDALAVAREHLQPAAIRLPDWVTAWATVIEREPSVVSSRSIVEELLARYRAEAG